MADIDAARFLVAVSDDAGLVQRLMTEVATQADPAITVTRDLLAVLAFECQTWDSVLRSRVVQALEVAVESD